MEQVIVVIERTQVANVTYTHSTVKSKSESKHFFRNFDYPENAISFISNEIKASLKVYKILKVDINGVTKEMTIGFIDGVLSLIEVYPKSVAAYDLHEC